MQARKSFFVGLVLLASVALAQAKQQKTPQLLLNGQYVYVEPLLGDGKFADPSVSPEDRQAVTDVVAVMTQLYEADPASDAARVLSKAYANLVRLVAEP